ncbi:hypothetical protein PUNSTDRAFT_46624 [Punctularia strigosozonata HHB-11173 SS5]|uniref:uncharacterized protein n=1 Tax=Punctularia strigosozonata (strain HHB-11173) TaxID=741275 RepID=UPI0004416585|nr:uncharacterized protein PUNSTDRAFT_46624 [Punctularia strigosozonata HHB-11173 SS5]EIN05772.1 hypothetical protein PUNSTDRAFT_46624 [Punctularia strigosozonata HHB-11173 SS5]
MATSTLTSTDHSFTSCNTLSSNLAMSVDPESTDPEPSHVATFLTERWWATEISAADGSLAMGYHPAMLTSQALLRFLHHDRHVGSLGLSDDLLSVKIPITLMDILTRTLELQNGDGSWGDKPSREATAQAVITLANLASLPYVELIRDHIYSAIAAGRSYLVSVDALLQSRVSVDSSEHRQAIEVEEGVNRSSEPYASTALHLPIPLYDPASADTGITVPTDKIQKFCRFYHQLPIYKGYPAWRLFSWLITSYIYLPELRRIRLNVFNRQGMNEDPYFEYLPFCWIGPNCMEKTYASPYTMFDLMVIIMVNFQVDEFFDLVVRDHGEGALAHVQQAVEEMCNDLEDGVLPDTLAPSDDASISPQEHVRARLGHFLRFLFSYPRIQCASDADKAHLRKEIRIFLMAHATQCEDNIRLQSQERTDLFCTPRSSYLRWVRSTAADHFSTQYTFAFMTCLLGHAGNKGRTAKEWRDYFPTAELKYIAQDCATHVSVICRQFNDYGSLSRDREERNLNGVFFPEFEGRIKAKSDLLLKSELRAISDYERRIMDLTYDELLRVAQGAMGPEQGKRAHKLVRLFRNVGDLYNQIYELSGLES